MIDAAAEKAEPLGGVLHVNLSLVLDVFRGLEIVQGYGSLVLKQLGALELDASEFFVGHRLSIVGKCT
jgi:hypothetical protein